MIIETEFAIGSTVKIIALNYPARVSCIQISLRGLEIGVTYWHNGENKFVYLHPEELTTSVQG